jgi:hypothetical protein
VGRWILGHCMQRNATTNCVLCLSHNSPCTSLRLVHGGFRTKSVRWTQGSVLCFHARGSTQAAAGGFGHVEHSLRLATFFNERRWHVQPLQGGHGAARQSCSGCNVWHCHQIYANLFCGGCTITAQPTCFHCALAARDKCVHVAARARLHWII